MPFDSSEDEFDAMSDPFEGVDWNTVAYLNEEHGPRRDPNHGAAQTLSANRTLQREANASSSSAYDVDDDFDASFLEDLDALESRVATPANSSAAASASARRHEITRPRVSPYIPGQVGAASRSSYAPAASRTPKRDRSLSSLIASKQQPNYLESPGKKARIGLRPAYLAEDRKKTSTASPNDAVREVLADFEDEFTCPICCDLFVAAHVGNPCGHCYCGECGYSWMSQNKRSPTCCVCRAPLTKAAPIIPNFVMDNVIEKHIKALGSSGLQEWQAGGPRLRDWTTRKEKWKTDSAKRAVQAKPSVKRTRQRSIIFIDSDVEPEPLFVPDYDDAYDDPSYEEQVDFQDDDLEVQEILMDRRAAANGGGRRRRVFDAASNAAADERSINPPWLRSRRDSRRGN